VAAQSDNPEISTINTGTDEYVFYSNIASVSATPEEAFIHFGLRTDKEPNRGIGVARAYLSLPHAKRLLNALATVIAGYERTFGTIEVDTAKRLTPEGRELLQVQATEGEN